MRTLSRRLVFVLVLAALFSLVASPALAASTPSAGATGPRQAQSQAGSVAIVNVPWLNVRGGPGTGYRILTHASTGAALDVQGKSASGAWIQVHTPDGFDGWVSAQFVTLSSAASGEMIPYRMVAPAIGLDARVVPAGWHTVYNANGAVSSEWDVPSYAAGWFITTAHPGEVGNMVISGHHNIEGQVFRYVVNLKIGDQITVYAGNRAFNYAVTQTMIVPEKFAPYEQRMENAKWIGTFPDERLTLVTCWPYTNNTHRVIVVAKPTGAQ